MTEMRLETLTMPAANLGPENPLPPIVAAADLHAAAAPRIDASVPPEDRDFLGWGNPPGLLPYRLQDGYDRHRAPCAFNVVVLENEHLRATFLPELGGRLWSLVHKATGRELFSRNPVFQPGNLALRNAWISGGIEIQAGLARTQGHHVPMPPNTTWSWLEAYGDLAVDPADAYATDWTRARQAAEADLEAQIPAARLDALLEQSEQWANVPPTSAPFCRGGDWGALESARRQKSGEPGQELPGIVFPADAMGPELQEWKTLLDTGSFPEGEPEDDPGRFMVQREWMDALEHSLAQPGGRHWKALFHFGLMLWHHGRRDEAVARWKESLRESKNPWAEYCLGVSNLPAQPEQAARHFERAFALRPDLARLAVEWLSTLLKCGKPRKVLQVVKTLPEPLRSAGRIRLLVGQALLETGKLDELDSLLGGGLVVPDLREGETSTSDLWIGLQAKRLAKERGVAVDDALRQEAEALHPVPRHLDFRMHS